MMKIIKRVVDGLAVASLVAAYTLGIGAGFANANSQQPHSETIAVQ
jgi:hypothetical protein